MQKFFNQLFKKKLDPQQLRLAIAALLRARNDAEAIRVLQQHPELLTEDAQDLMVEMGNASDGERIQEIFEERLALLRNSSVSSAAPKSYQLPTSQSRGVDAPPEFRSDWNVAETTLKDYQKTGQIASLDAAMQTWGRIMTRPSFGQASERFRLAVWNNAAMVFLTRYWRAGAIQDLNTALELWKRAATTAPLDSPDRPTYLSNLSHGLRDRYARTGHLEDLEEAIRVSEDALASIQPDSPERPFCLGSLSAGRYSRYLHSGHLEDLEEAIELWQEAIRITPLNSPERPGRLNNLSNGLRARYQRTGRLEDLEEAIRLTEQVVRDTPPDSPDQTDYLNNLSIDLHSRYLLTGRLEDLEKAVRMSKQAVASAPRGSSNRPMYLTNLGGALRDRYARTGHLEDLEEAIRVSEQALASLPPDSPDRPGYLINLGGALRDRYLRTGKPKNLEEVIHIWRQALEGIAPDSPKYPVYLHNLGTGLQIRYTRTRKPEDLEEARRIYQQSCELAEHHSQQVMLTSGRTWGDWAFERQAWQEASQAYTYGLLAIRNLYRAQFSRTGKESFIRDARGLPARAAHAMVKSGNLPAALEILESGRARLLGEALERTRRDLEMLAEPAVGHKVLLDQYREVTDRYTGLSQMVSNVGKTGVRTTSHQRQWIQQLESCQTEIDKVIEEIRRVPGYDTFLLSPVTAQIQHQALNAPLVYLAVTSAGGLVLLAAGNEIYAIELPMLTEDSLRKQVIGEEGQVTYRRAYLDWRADPYDDLKRETWKRALDQTARWLWDAIMQPVVEKLKTIIKSGNLVVLIPSGLLSLLPLHAAWTPDESRACSRLYAIDEFMFTYAPSALALMRSHQQSKETPAEKLLVVENPDQSLHFSEPAVQAALALFNDKTHLSRGKATFDTVRSAFNDHNVVYFFTHGIARFDEPLASSLALADHPLTLADIFNLKTGNTRLAVLSACETGLPSNLELLDEAVSLPSGFMQAGVPGVVGSLWSVQESSTAILMAIFFEQWRKSGLSAPEALRKAQVILRDATYNNNLQNYFKESLTAPTLALAEVADMLHKELLINEFDHPFYWAAFTFTGL